MRVSGLVVIRLQVRPLGMRTQQPCSGGVASTGAMALVAVPACTQPWVHGTERAPASPTLGAMIAHPAAAVPDTSCSKHGGGSPCQCSTSCGSRRVRSDYANRNWGGYTKEGRAVPRKGPYGNPGWDVPCRRRGVGRRQPDELPPLLNRVEAHVYRPVCAWSACPPRDAKRAGAHAALDSLLFYYTISRHGAAMLPANAVAPRKAPGGVVQHWLRAHYHPLLLARP